MAAADISRLYALHIKEPVPEVPPGRRGVPEILPSWFFKVDDLLRAVPRNVVEGKKSILYVCSFDHRAYAVDGSSGRALWTSKTGRQIVCPPLILGDRIFIGGLDHTVHALDRRTGGCPLWLFPTGGPVEREFWGDGDTLYVRAENVLDEYGLPGDAVLYAVDVISGKKRWQLAKGLRMLISGKEKVYVLREGQVLVLVDKTTGKLLAEYPLPDFPFLPTNDQDRTLYLATKSGQVFAFQE
jgi:outer membrane protein assembly factor BamB